MVDVMEGRLVPKIRGVKPDYWTDEDIVELSIPARLLFIGLWNLACDNGHVPDKPKQIKMRLLPADALDVDKLLTELEANGRLKRLDGTIEIHNFAHHQKPHRRWWTTCALPFCSIPEDAPEQGFNRGETHSGTHPQPGNNRGTTVGNGRTTADGEGEGDVDSDGELSRPATKRAHKLPDDWAPNDTHKRIAVEQRVPVDVEATKMRDWADSKGITRKDWDATFRNWLRNAKPTIPAPRATTGSFGVQGW
jgi:hypothetical protein